MAATERFENDAQTTLNGAIADGTTTSITVSSSSGFPPAATSTSQFRIRVDNEILLVTNGSPGTSWTVARGQEGTTAASHVDKSAVVHVLTRDAIKQTVADNCQTGTDASLTANEKAGRLYWDSDSIYTYRDTGSAWTPFGPNWQLTKPVPGNYSWINQGTATVTTTGGTIFLRAPAAAGSNIRAQVKTVPTAPYTITALLQPVYGPGQGNQGLVWSNGTNGSTSKIVVFRYYMAAGDVYVSVTKYANSTDAAPVEYFTAVKHNFPNPLLWMRIKDDNTNRICYFSTDGYNFIQVHSVGRTDFFTATHTGFYCESGNATYDSGTTLASWLES